MNKRIKKKFHKRSDTLLKNLCIYSRTVGGPMITTTSEITIKDIRRFKRIDVRLYRIFNLSKATKGDGWS